MSDPFHNRPFPKKPLYAIGTLLLLTILFAGFARITGIGVIKSEPTPELAGVDLFFEDRADGAILVYTAQERTLVAEIPPASNGFIRGVMRSLARGRRIRDLTDDAPFRLARHIDGRLTIEDLATRQVIELSAFGPTNEAAFAYLLPKPDGAPGKPQMP